MSVLAFIAAAHNCHDSLQQKRGQAACWAGANLAQFFSADHLPFFIAQEAQNAGRGDDGKPILVDPPTPLWAKRVVQMA